MEWLIIMSKVLLYAYCIIIPIAYVSIRDQEKPLTKILIAHTIFIWMMTATYVIIGGSLAIIYVFFWNIIPWGYY